MSDKKWRYSVLYVKSIKSFEISQVLRSSLPEGHGEVFYPCAEYWMKGKEEPVVRPLWPGYVFVRSDLSFLETHQIIKDRRWDAPDFISEVHLKSKIASGDWLYDIGEGGKDPILTDLNEEEAEFLDFMLSFRRTGNARWEAETGEAEGDSAKLSVNASDREQIAQAQGKAADGSEAFNANEIGKSRGAVKIPKAALNTPIGSTTLRGGGKRLPERGVLRASSGYREGGRIVVMEGPLKGHEDHIVGLNARDKKAYLDVMIGGKNAKAGLKLMGKRYWFPDDKNAPDVLKDGTEVDVKDLARKMMGGR